ncbi:MAG: carbamoyl-phosphate synthase (glutamine-hydrolyzing) large subunit [Myxococcaceae bacterium]
MTVLLLGSGALQIGQAGEFDYSGSQALKALKEEGIRTILLNPNIATVQTDSGMADETYFLPVQPEIVEQILIKEKCDSLLLSFGGQTALNSGLALEASGVLARLGVKVLGTPVKTIRDTEDRHLFVERLKEIGVSTARSRAVSTVEAALEAAKYIGYPVMIRSGFSLGGKGSSIVDNPKSCLEIAEMALANVPQILVEECLSGWKEIEYEVVRDADDNCITVCNMENVDPMGIHTGESIVVAPSQTLDDFEYQMLRNIAIKTIRHLGIVGECNIQYALDPKSRDYRVIEVNARLSRSSALASKATGYPLAYVACKIALGYSLPEIPNSITKITTSFFEPALDYIVCKVPRWDLDKFENSHRQIGSEMKSVGEVMAIGRSFPEVLQKAFRMLEIGVQSFTDEKYTFDDLEKELREPTPRRMFAVAQAFRQGFSTQQVANLTKIDLFFLEEINRVVQLEKAPVLDLKALKQAGTSDKRIAKLSNRTETQVREERHQLGLKPYLAQIDTLAAEYPAETNFLYFTYHASQSDVEPSKKKKVIVLGSGCYRIGSSVEFDWCAVNAAKAAQQLGYDAILVNCNPETVSTDYNMGERLVFDECSLETILELYDFEKPEGVLVSMGGQTPNNLVVGLAAAGVKILGTAPEFIDMAEDRSKFSALLDKLKIDQPKWRSALGLLDIEKAVEEIGGYPVLIRPSYVLSGAAMRVTYNHAELVSFLQKATDISSEYPVVLSKFEENAREIELDGVANQGELKLCAISEHIENAGVHSGDATLVFPAQRLGLDVTRGVREIGEKLARELKITGPFNLQLLLKNNNLKVIELNLRASRSFPFVSKVLGLNLIQEATRYILGAPGVYKESPNLSLKNYVAVKAPQFSFNRIKGADPKAGIEMASTGEVACFGRNTEEALLKSLLATGFKMPKKGVLIDSEFDFAEERKMLSQMGLPVFEVGIDPEKYDWLISTQKEGFEQRRYSCDMSRSLTTDIWVAKRLIKALHAYHLQEFELSIQPISHYVQQQEL